MNLIPDSFQSGAFSYEIVIPSAKEGTFNISSEQIRVIILPKVRNLEPIQLPADEDSPLPRFLLKDSAGLSTEQLIVSLAGLYLVELADGTRDIAGIAQALKERTGISADHEAVENLLVGLDREYLLDNERARARLAQLSPRPVRHGAAGYPPLGGEFEAFLDDLLGADAPLRQEFRRASVLPHIDFFRGLEAYRAGYQHLHGLKNAPGGPPTVVILGISHAYCRTPFILTRKDFDTPLGVSTTDQSLVDILCEGLPFDPFLDEYNHMGEHSVEFHAILLKRLVPEARIVPVLCRSFHQAVLGKFSPLKLPGVKEFVGNLARIRDSRPDVHFLASVDLAHKGLNFGEKRLTREFLKELEARDLESLRGVEAGRADDFFSTHQADQGERNYCGIPAIYTLLHLFPQPFELHSYRQCTDPDLGSTVTVASASLP